MLLPSCKHASAVCMISTAVFQAPARMASLEHLTTFLVQSSQAFYIALQNMVKFFTFLSVPTVCANVWIRHFPAAVREVPRAAAT